MTLEKVLYTDGHEVTVTDSFFQVRKTLYQLQGITKHGFQTIQPDRLPAFFVALLGLMLITLGTLHMVPGSSIPDVELYSMTISANSISLGLGITLFAGGSALIALMKERYAVRIATAEGEKNVIVSRRKEYITQIVEALNKAFLNLVLPSREKVSKDRNRA